MMIWDIYGTPKSQNLFIKKCILILICLNFSHLQTTLHLMQYTYWDFFPLLKIVFELIDFDAFLVLLLFFVSRLPHWQNVSLWGLISSGETNKVTPRSWCFRSPTADHSAWCGQVRSQITHHEMSKCVERVFKKNSLKLNAASHNNPSWYTDTNGFL